MFKVRSKYLLLIAAAVWLIAGSQVARMGIEAIGAGNKREPATATCGFCSSAFPPRSSSST